MGIREYNGLHRVLVPGKNGPQQAYFRDLEAAKETEREFLSDAVAEGTRRMGTKRSRATGKPVTSALTLLRKDGTAFCIGAIIDNHGYFRVRVTIVKDEGRHKVSWALWRKQDIKPSYMAAVSYLASQHCLDERQIKTIQKAWPAFQRRYHDILQLV